MRKSFILRAKHQQIAKSSISVLTRCLIENVRSQITADNLVSDDMIKKDNLTKC